MYLYAIFILAFVLRLVNLNQSLWLDEAIVAKVVKTIPFHLIPTQLSPVDVHPPLYYIGMSLWTNIFGNTEIALRMPSVFFSLIAGWYIYKIGLELKGKQTGMWAALFFLFNPLIIYYSQEARMHMMAAMFLSMSLYYFLKIIRAKPVGSKTLLRNSILYNLFCALALFTFYGSAFFIGGMILVGIFMLLKRIPTKQGFKPILTTLIQLSIGSFFSLLLLSPLLFEQIINARSGLFDLKNWSMALGKAEFKNVLMIFLKFVTGRLSWYPKWSYYLTAGIPTAVIWIFVGMGMKKNKTFAALFILPLLFGLCISFWAPMMMYFRFLYLIPVMSILLAQNERVHKFKLNYCLVVIFIIFSCVYLFNPQFHREDWKKLTQALDNRIPVYMILPSSDPITYYRHDISMFELRTINQARLQEFIYVVPYTSELYGFNYTQILQKKECTKQSLTHFRGDVTLEKWKCPWPSLVGHANVGTI
ncbi:MAG: glycosyltransferase family 39 protein [bacterium]